MNDLSDDARRLIEAAAGADGPSPTRLDAIGTSLFRKLGPGAVALSGMKLAAASTAAPAVKAGLSIAAYFWIGVTAGVGLVGTSAALDRLQRVSPAPTTVVAAPTAPARSRPAAPEGPALGTVVAPGDAGTLAVPTPKPRPEAPTRSEGAFGQASSLSAEVASLREIQAFLAAGDGARALAASDRYLAEHRAGTLRDEHLAARVLAFCLVGDETRARAAARLFVATSAASPLLPRLARSCVADVVGKR